MSESKAGLKEKVAALEAQLVRMDAMLAGDLPEGIAQRVLELVECDCADRYDLGHRRACVKWEIARLVGAHTWVAQFAALDWTTALAFDEQHNRRIGSLRDQYIYAPSVNPGFSVLSNFAHPTDGVDDLGVRNWADWQSPGMVLQHSRTPSEIAAAINATRSRFPWAQIEFRISVDLFDDVMTLVRGGKLAKLPPRPCPRCAALGFDGFRCTNIACSQYGVR